MFIPKFANLQAPVYFADDAKTGGGDDGDKGDPSTTQDPPTATKEDGQSDGNGQPPGKTYTEEEVNALDRKLQKRAATASRKALLEELGVDNLDTLKEMITADTEAKEAQLSDAQKAQKAAEAAQAEAETAIAQAKVDSLTSRLSTALAETGRSEHDDADPCINVKGAMAIALPLAQASDETVVEAVIAEAIEQTRATVPEVFGTQAGDAKSPPASGTPGRTNGQRSTNRSGSKPDAGEAIRAWQKTQAGRVPPLPGQSKTT